MTRKTKEPSVESHIPHSNSAHEAAEATPLDDNVEVTQSPLEQPLQATEGELTDFDRGMGGDYKLVNGKRVRREDV